VSARELQTDDLLVEHADAMAWLRRPGERFDVAFVDPPYDSGLAGAALAALPARLNTGARVYVESAAPLAPGAPWRVLREDRAGAVRYALYELGPT
jgi:16S rRNA (guanine966-N2)-methyltransferase